MKHTKGPWVVVKFDESNEIQTVDGKIIADVWKKNNSALFVVAPEMLAMLESIYENGLHDKSGLLQLINKAKNLK